MGAFHGQNPTWEVLDDKRPKVKMEHAEFQKNEEIREVRPEMKANRFIPKPKIQEDQLKKQYEQKIANLEKELKEQQSKHE